MTVTHEAVPKRSRFLTVEQIAEEWAIREPTVRHFLSAGELRGLQIGVHRTWRVAAKDLEDYIEQAYRVTAERIAAGEAADDVLSPTLAGR